jgi:N-acetylglucosamine-6-phosphate deacetylase
LSLTDRGAIEPGRRADIVVLDTDLCVTRTIIEGHTAWKS